MASPHFYAIAVILLSTSANATSKMFLGSVSCIMPNARHLNTVTCLQQFSCARITLGTFHTAILHAVHCTRSNPFGWFYTGYAMTIIFLTSYETYPFFVEPVSATLSFPFSLFPLPSLDTKIVSKLIVYQSCPLHKVKEIFKSVI